MTNETQYFTSSPNSKKLTIVDTNVSPNDIWEVETFYLKNVTDISGPRNNTKKVRIKIRNNAWDESGIPDLKPRQLWGDEVVVTHTKLDYDVYSGHIDDVEKKQTGRILELHVTEVSDRTN